MSSCIAKRPRCCSLMTSSVLVALVVYVNSMCVPKAEASASFEFNAYCQKLCLWGRGGNLCRCNAVHFVGKRRNAVSSTFSRAPFTPGGDVIDMASTDNDESQLAGTTIDLYEDNGNTLTHQASRYPDKRIGGGSSSSSDMTYIEPDDDGSGAMTPLDDSTSAAAAGSRGLAINESRDVSDILLSDDDASTTGHRGADTGIDLETGGGDNDDVGSRSPLIVIREMNSHEREQGRVARAAGKLGGKVGKQAVDGNQASPTSKIRFYFRPEQSQHNYQPNGKPGSKPGSKKRRRNISNVSTSRQKFLTLNMLTRQPASSVGLGQSALDIPPSRLREWPVYKSAGTNDVSPSSE